LAYATILLRAVHGSVSIGTLAMLIGAFARARNIMEGLVSGLAGLAEQSYFLKDLFDFFATTPKIISVRGAVCVPRPIRRGFEFQSVSFAYPGSDHDVLCDI